MFTNQAQFHTESIDNCHRIEFAFTKIRSANKQQQNEEVNYSGVGGGGGFKIAFFNLGVVLQLMQPD